jgi:hypothetical protein
MTSTLTIRSADWRASASSDALRERLRQAGAANLAVAPHLSSGANPLDASASVILLARQGGAPSAAETVTYESAVSAAMPLKLTTTPVVSFEEVQSRRSAWANEASAHDAISRLMEHNAHTGGWRGLLTARWQGLGSALLAQLVASPGDQPLSYQQSYLASVDAKRPIEGQFSDLKSGAATVSLQIQTRSGQTVDLQIAVKGKLVELNPGNRGMHVSVSSSGALSVAEREALAALSNGLEQALAGLGQKDARASQLNLSGLMNFDRKVFSSLSLEVDNPYVHFGAQGTSWMAPTQSLALHLGDRDNTLAWKGVTEGSRPDASRPSEIKIRVDAQTLLPASGSQRQAAMAQYLQQIDAAADRSHASANHTLMAMFKNSFMQMHGLTSSEAVGVAAFGPGLTDKVAPLLSGLADFDASFSGTFVKTKENVGMTEQGDVDYRIGQQTEVTTNRAAKTARITQTQSEQLRAQYLKTRGEGRLDVDSGSYDVYTISDDNRITTSILADTEKGRLLGAERHVQKNQLQTWKLLVQDLVKDRRDTPDRQDYVTQLL